MQRRSDALTTYTEAATNMFSRIKTESEVSVGEMIANLEFNQEALTQWADNLVMLGNRGVNEGLLQTLREAGPESAATVSALVTASDEQLARLSETQRDGSLVFLHQRQTRNVVECRGDLWSSARITTIIRIWNNH